MGWLIPDLILGSRRRFFSSPQCVDQLWVPSNLLFNRCRGFISGGRAAEWWRWLYISILCDG